MRRLRTGALGLLLAVAALALFGPFVYHRSEIRQFRGQPDAPPSRQFPLGTDELGRDRLARLIQGTRVSLLLAPAAALLTGALAALAGATAAALGGWGERAVLQLIDLTLSIPWLFLLITVRSLLPLDAPEAAPVTLTFALLALLGWAGPARILRAATRAVLSSDYLLQARAAGIPHRRLLLRHVLPNLKPALLAQTWVAIPFFVLTEANLGLLGLGVAEPTPSWGNLLHQLETRLTWDAGMLAPLFLVVTVVACFRFFLPEEESL